MAPPVGAVQLGVAAQRRAGPVADQNPLRRAEFEAARKGLERVECGIEQRRVERVAGLQPFAAHPVGRQSGDHLFEVCRRSRQHGVGSVVRGHRKPREFVGEALDAKGICEDRRHPPASREITEKPPPFGEQSDAVLEAEDSGDAGGRVLTDAVSENDVGLQTP